MASSLPLGGEHSTTLRLVTAFQHEGEDVTAFVEAARRLSCGFHTALGD